MVKKCISNITDIIITDIIRCLGLYNWFHTLHSNYSQEKCDYATKIKMSDIPDICLCYSIHSYKFWSKVKMLRI